MAVLKIILNACIEVSVTSWVLLVELEHLCGDHVKMVKVHKFKLRMTEDQDKLELFLNSLDGEIVAIIPNVTAFPSTYVDFVLVVEKVD